ncbi:MAG TPA: hypothetical protein VM186_12005 [Planctomycetota bacterium]|nr:hypothetical protein [Planctomycetota bacterium]
MSKTKPGSRLNIAFTDERWQHVEQEWVKFWNGEQNRPMVNIAFTGPDTPEVPEYRSIHCQ